MAIFRRGQIYWSDITVDGIRYRRSLKTTDWRKAQNSEKKLIKQAASGHLSPRSDPFVRLGFVAAADRYLEDRRPELSEASYKKERQLLVQPKRCFKSMPLHRLETRHLLDYRDERMKSVGATIINMEIGAIGRIMRKARRWHLVVADVKPLRQSSPGVGRALTEHEKKRLLGVAASKTEWAVTHSAATLALNTTMRACEIRNLQWKDVNLVDRIVTVHRSKTAAGQRTIPLNDSAFSACMAMRRRAEAFEVEATGPECYVFPSCENGSLDPARPQRSWRTSWRRLTKEAGLKGLRFHDLRHHAITELAESQASDQTILSLAGHVSRRMLDHYSHIRMDAKRQAVGTLEGKKQGGETTEVGEPTEDSYVTNHDTNGSADESASPQLVEK